MTLEDTQAVYDELYERGITSIKEETYQVDSLLDDPLDDRRGLTLLIRFPDEVKEKIRQFLDELRLPEPEQYYYPQSDLHITLLSIVTCYEGFKPEEFDTDCYVRLIERTLREEDSFTINFCGVTVSPSCVMIQGFPEKDGVNKLREKLRNAFFQSNLFQTIDTRYVLRTSHSTVARYRKKLSNPFGLQTILEKYRNHYFGMVKVNSVELVFNDWYQRKEHGKLICDFKLK